MTPTEVAVKLRAFNEWRRGDEDIPQFDPREIGEVIDAAVEMIDRLAVLPARITPEQAPDERDVLRACCGTFHGSRHRITCEKYKGKREPGDKP